MPPLTSGVQPFSTINYYLNNYRSESLKTYRTSLTFFTNYLTTLFELHRLLHIEWYQTTIMCDSCEITYSTKYPYIDIFDPSRNIFAKCFLVFCVYFLRITWQADHTGRAVCGTRTLGLWVRIPFEAWMFVCAYSVFVLFCDGLTLPPFK
jgi:hypothetical protein